MSGFQVRLIKLFLFDISHRVFWCSEKKERRKGNDDERLS